jgi:uncharacterized protein YaaR (DUF327 family)
MERVDTLGSAVPHREPERRKKIDRKRRAGGPALRPSESAGAGAFSQLLAQPGTEEALEDLLDEVNESGERLHESQSLENIKAFRDSVKRFLSYVMKRALEVTEHVSGTNILKRKKFTLIDVIDRKLESLAGAVLAGQADQMEILRRIDEIKGLIVDLVT